MKAITKRKTISSISAMIFLSLFVCINANADNDSNDRYEINERNDKSRYYSDRKISIIIPQSRSNDRTYNNSATRDSTSSDGLDLSTRNVGRSTSIIFSRQSALGNQPAVPVVFADEGFGGGGCGSGHAGGSGGSCYGLAAVGDWGASFGGDDGGYSSYGGDSGSSSDGGDSSGGGD